MGDLRALPVGTELVGDYRIRRVLGAGGFGITYLAEEPSLARLVTIKEYFPSDFAVRDNIREAVPRSQNCAEDYQWGLDRFIDEAQALAKFDHPNIVRVYRYFRLHKTGYMVLHFEEGASLKLWLKNLRRAPAQSELDAIVAPLLDALELIHSADFLHRDIAPDNIIIRKSSTPVLIDFGSARGQIAQHSKTISALVKPGYSPYEQYAMTSRNQGPWTDIYSLAATLYFAVCGKRPIDAPSRIVADELQAARDAALSSYRPEFLAAIDKALRLDVRQRPQSIAQWRSELLGRGELLAPGLNRALSQGAARQREAPIDTPSSPVGTPAAPGQVQQPAHGLGVAQPPPAPSIAQAAPFRAPAQALTQAQLQNMQQAGPRPAAPTPAPRPANIPPGMRPGPAGIQHRPSPAAAPAPAAAARPAPPAPRPIKAPKQAGAHISPAKTKVLTKSAYASATRRGLLNLFSGAKKKAAEANKPAGQQAGPKPAKKPNKEARAKTPSPDAGAIKKTPPKPSAKPAAKRAVKQAPAKPARVGAGKKSKPAPSHVVAKAVNTAPAALPLQPRAAKRKPPQPHRNRAKNTWGWRSLMVKLMIGVGVASAAVAMQDKLPRLETRGTGQLSSQRTDINLVNRIKAHDTPARTISFTAGGTQLVSTGDDATIKLWNAISGNLIRTIELDDGPATALAVQYGRAVTGHKDGTIALWDLSNGVKITSFKRNDANIWSLTFLGDSGRIASAAHDWSVNIWDERNSGDPVKVLNGHKNAAQAVAFSSGRSYLASGGADKTIKLWNTSTMKLVRSYRKLPDFVTSLSFSPDGRNIAAACLNGVIKIFSARSRSTRRTLRGHKSRVTAIAYAPGSRFLASASLDGDARLWDTSRGRTVKTFRAFAGPVHSLAFSPDGSHLATAGEDGVLRIWNVSRLMSARKKRR